MTPLIIISAIVDVVCSLCIYRKLVSTHAYDIVHVAEKKNILQSHYIKYLIINFAHVEYTITHFVAINSLRQADTYLPWRGCQIEFPSNIPESKQAYYRRVETSPPYYY